MNGNEHEPDKRFSPGRYTPCWYESLPAKGPRFPRNSWGTWSGLPPDAAICRGSGNR